MLPFAFCFFLPVPDKSKKKGRYSPVLFFFARLFSFVKINKIKMCQLHTTSSRLCPGALLVVLLVACTYAAKPGPVFLFSMYPQRSSVFPPQTMPSSFFPRSALPALALPAESVLSVDCTLGGGVFARDGMRTDYLQQARALGLPTLTRLIEGGTLASASQTVWPAVTFPSHTRYARVVLWCCSVVVLLCSCVVVVCACY